MATAATREQYRRAIAEAQRLRGWERLRRLTDGRWEVRGRVGDRYAVRVDEQGEYWCSCAAGVRERPCWHAATVWLDTAARAAFRPLAATAPTPIRRVDSVLGRPSGRGIGVSPADLGDEEEATLMELLTAAGWKP